MAVWKGKFRTADADRIQSVALIYLLEHAVEDETYAQVLAALADGVRVAGRRISRADEAGTEEYAAFVIDDECDVIENLLGAAFVVCQAKNSSITAAAKRAREHAATLTAHAKLPATAKAMMSEGRPFSAAHPELTQIDMIWALGNYFKHRDEWGSRWGKKDRQSQATMATVRVAGLAPGSTGNLRTGAEALGNEGFDKMDIFIEVIRDWSQRILQSTAAALDVLPELRPQF